MSPRSRRPAIVLSAFIALALLAINVLVVRASLTLSGTAVTGDGTLNLTGVGTSTIDLGSGTLQLQTTNGGPITTGAGLFTDGGSLAIKGPTPWIDVRTYGAKCDATYNVTTQAITGTDDTTAIQNAINALPTLGGVIYVPGHCRFTSPLNVSSTFVTIRGISGWVLSGSQDTASALIFDSSTGTALNVSGGGFTLEDIGLFTKNGANGLSVYGGNAFIRNAKVFNINGACPSCAPGPTSGKGIDIPSLSSGYTIYDSQVAGYEYGIDNEAGNGFSMIGGNEILSNGVNLRLGNASGISQAYIAGNHTFQDPTCNGCGATFTPGNIDIIQGQEVVIDGNYFENGSNVGGVTQNGFNVRVGSGSGTPANIRFTDNYLTCNTNASATSTILIKVDGWDEAQNDFTSCPGTIISNATSGTSDLYFRDDYFNASNGTYLTSYHGVVQNDNPANPFFGIGTRNPSSTYTLSVQATSTINPLAILTANGSTVFTVASSGNIGINLTNPIYPLDMYASSSVTSTNEFASRSIFHVNASGDGTANTYYGGIAQTINDLTTGNGNYNLTGLEGNAYAAAPNNADLFNITGLYGFAQNGSGVNQNAYGVYGESYGQSGNLTNGYGVYGIAHVAAGTVTNNIGGYFTATGATNNYALITGSGNVGIGTSAPSSSLHVFTTSSTVTIGNASNTGCLELGSASGTAKLVYVWFDSNATIYATTTKPAFCQ